MYLYGDLLPSKANPMDRPHEYCGIFGVFNHPDAARLTYYGLHALQHRGQESAGIVTLTYDERRGRKVLLQHKGLGLVTDVFASPELFDTYLHGDSAIGHNRYSTTGASGNPANVQPFAVHYRNGNLALAHNGNLSNARQLRQRLSQEGVLFMSTSDSELILHLIARSPQPTVLGQVLDALHQIQGAYALLILTDEALLAIRDPHGFRPLALGRIGEGYCVASETCAFDLIGAHFIRDIEPGEVLLIDREACRTGRFQRYSLRQSPDLPIAQCIFEFIYFARPDSWIFGEQVDKVRRRLGKALAHEHPVPRVPPGERPPLVISVPDSSNTATIGYASECNKLGYPCKLDIGLIRNHYVGRTFIQPGQGARELKVKLKFNPVRSLLRDRIVVLVDDSIVRGTTSRYLVQMIREAGAREVHFRVSSPPIIAPCFYGMDFPSLEELVANRFERDIERIRDFLGVDSLGYLSVEGLMRAVRSATNGPDGFCNACFTERYPVPVELGVLKEEND